LEALRLRRFKAGPSAVGGLRFEATIKAESSKEKKKEL
jgi:hypothetical protein